MDYDAKYVRGRALLNDDYDLDETGHLLYRDANRNQLRSKVSPWTTSWPGPPTPAR